MGRSAAEHRDDGGRTADADQISARIKNTIGMMVRHTYPAARFAGFSHASNSRNVLW